MQHIKQFGQSPAPLAELERQRQMRAMYERIAQGNAMLEAEQAADKRSK